MEELHSVVSQEQVETERALIGAVVRAPEFSMREAGWLTEETFMVPDHKIFWNRVLNGEDPLVVIFDMPTMSKALSWSNDALYNRVGDYATALHNKDYMRTAILAAEEIVKAARDGNRDLIQAIANTLSTSHGGSTGMRDALEIAESLNARIDSGNQSIPWGIASLDAATMGQERGTLTMLAARPSMGKSSLAFQCNEYQALERDLRVGVWALEMSGEQMFARRNCHKVNKTWMEVRSENITQSEKADLKQHNLDYAELIQGKLHINDKTHTTSADIIRTQLREQFDVVMIDHLGLLKDRPLRGERHDQKLGRISMALHELAKNTNCVVLLLAQLNRNLEQRSDKRPTMADLRDSGELEQNADNVALIYGEWYYDKNADNITELNFGKYRDGVKDRTAYVRFNMVTQQFDTVTQEELDEMSEEAMEEVYATGDATPKSTQTEIPF